MNCTRPEDLDLLSPECIGHAAACKPCAVLVRIALAERAAEQRAVQLTAPEEAVEI